MNTMASTIPLWLENLYIQTRGGSVLWAIFALSAVLLLFAMVWPAKPLRWSGFAVFIVAAVLSAGAFAVRWILSGRTWYLPPLTNQFEAVMGSVLLASAVATLLWRRGRGSLVMFSAALWGVAAMLYCFLLPEKTGSVISQPAGILRTPLLAAHVATIIMGHALAGMSAVISIVYLLAGLVRPPRDKGDLPSAPADLAGKTPQTNRASVDRTNLVLFLFAAWMIIIGTVLGAVWGDRAWGRWWGWDIKETWALINALVYVLILHLRFATSPRWRGAVTACGSLLGAGAMLFNWLAVNYLFTGLHSYASG
jgi:ABC-type transport system involved in cytochrome c biogenesis permease subunit